MPEAAVHEDRDLCSREDHVGSASYVCYWAYVHPVAQASAMEF